MAGMKNKVPTRNLLNREEIEALMKAQEEYIMQMMELTVEMIGLTEKSGQMMKDYVALYTKITAPARLRPGEVPE